MDGLAIVHFVLASSVQLIWRFVFDALPTGGLDSRYRAMPSGPDSRWCWSPLDRDECLHGLYYDHLRFRVKQPLYSVRSVTTRHLHNM
jgi:hypothetical protein